MRKKKNPLLLTSHFLLLTILCSAKAPAVSYYTPASHLFSCVVPTGWQVIEGRDGTHPAVHLLGPDDPLGLYRTGLDIHFFEIGDPGFKSFAAKLKELRRSDGAADRTVTNIKPLRILGSMAITFEVTEKRWLPLEGLPCSQQYVHRYIAMIAQGKNYYVVSLSSARSVYIDFKDAFSDFVKSFETVGSAKG